VEHRSDEGAATNHMKVERYVDIDVIPDGPST